MKDGSKINNFGPIIEELDAFVLRDSFAMAALTGILFAAGAMVLDDNGLKSEIAKTAYEVADEMIAARERVA